MNQSLGAPFEAAFRESTSAAGSANLGRVEILRMVGPVVQPLQMVETIMIAVLTVKSGPESLNGLEFKTKPVERMKLYFWLHAVYF